jgi:homogentisate 1,2-dioxygenase
VAPSYHRLGDVPRKRHVAVRDESGGLRAEEVVGLEGFSGRYSILYHRYAPTRVLRVRAYEGTGVAAPAPSAETGLLRHHLLRTAGKAPVAANELDGRTPLFFNGDIVVGLSAFEAGDGPFVRNGGTDELHFVQEGSGRLESVFGVVDYRPGDYVVVPKGTTHRWVSADRNLHLTVDVTGSIRLPKRYQNAEGQLLEHAPYWERDFRRPTELLDCDERGEFDVIVRADGRASVLTLDHHPFDVVGWDGHLYPYAFSIHDFEPISGRQHMPPPVHQTFEIDGAVVCSFVPRRLDDGPDVVTAPYNHANLDSDELLFYVDGDFFSRKGIEPAAITWHPKGIPHGPAPGVAEASIGKTHTEEVAVMIDTFRPLTMTAAADAFDDPSYPLSWTAG